MRWVPGKTLPDGGELALHLARSGGFPDGDTADLLRVSQYYAVMLGEAPLYEQLRDLFDGDDPPTDVHALLASLPALRRQCKRPPRGDVLVTTNYDDALERAFTAAGETFDLLVYQAAGEQAGHYAHFAPGSADPVVIEAANEYRALSPGDRTVIVKLHGAIDRLNADRDSYVITEDDYIHYLANTDPAAMLPATVAARFKRSHFLFLGYGLRDWNLRVILHRIWGEQRLRFKCWAIQLHPSRLDQKFWAQHGVDIYDVRLEDYVAELRAHLDGCDAEAEA